MARQKTRRQRVDSVTAAVTIVAAATKGDLQPPEHVSVPEAALPFWHAIIRARPREDWEAVPALINTAANLAWTQWQIDQMRRMIGGEIPPPDGTAILQVTSGLLKLQRLEMGYLRVLQQHARAADGEARDASARRQKSKGIAAAAVAAVDDDDDLIARPTAH